jgi:hypothetical protein
LVLLVAGVAVAGSACEVINNPAAPAGSTGTLDIEADTAYCVEQTNALRAGVGAGPLLFSTEMRSFSDEAARVDGAAHQAHKYFEQTNGGGIATAENEIPWWRLGQYGSVHEIVRQGLALEWSEGPGGGHYDNMTGRYSQMSCGISVVNGEVTVSQDFR